jgi:flagellum-specific peptidoglycan hydrolase FlgJ
VDQDRFASNIFELAVETAKTRSVNAAIMAAQAVLESGYGRSILSKKTNNLFGIKAGKKWKGPRYPIRTREWSPEKGMYVIVAEFRTYPNWGECLADYSTIIESLPWYQDAASNAADPIKYLDGILPTSREPGWATDPHYRAKIIDIAKRHGWIS